LLHRRGQNATSLANRGGIPIAGQLEIILIYWRIGAPIRYTASLFANSFYLLLLTAIVLALTRRDLVVATGRGLAQCGPYKTYE
jgi:hypothetical protein